MWADEEEDERQYRVVLNDEEQYSIYLADRPLPNGWRPEGKVGGREECLQYIEEVWIDMRPASLRDPVEQPGRDGFSC